MDLACISATSGKQYPGLKAVQHSNAVHKAFGIKVENQKPDTLSGSSIKDLGEEKNIPGTLALLNLVKWAQEQQFEWEGSPNVGINHDAYFLEAAEAELEAKKKDSEFDI